MTAIAFFAAGTVTSGRAFDGITMLIGRSLQGIGAGGITGLCEVILTDMVPLRLRGRYLACINAVWAFGATTGPVIGAVLAQEATWRWIFYINIPIIFVPFIIIALVRLHYVPTSLGQKLGTIDYGGTLVFAGGIISLLIPVTWGGITYPWRSWHTLLPLFIGCAALVIFVGYEAHISSNPLIPVGLFRTRTLFVSFYGTMAHGLILSCGLYYLPVYFQAVKGYSPILSGLALLPVTFTVVPSAMVAGIVISKTGCYRGVIWVGWLMTTVGLGLSSLVRLHSTNALWISCLVIIGLGIGVLFSALNLAVLAATTPQPDKTAAAATMFTFFRILGQTLGVATGGTLFVNNVRASLLSRPGLLKAYGAAIHGDPANPVALAQQISQVPDLATRQQVQEAYVEGLRAVWAFGCALSGVTGLLSLGMKHYELSGGRDLKPAALQGGDATPHTELRREGSASETFA